MMRNLGDSGAIVDTLSGASPGTALCHLRRYHLGLAFIEHCSALLLNEPLPILNVLFPLCIRIALSSSLCSHILRLEPILLKLCKLLLSRLFILAELYETSTSCTNLLCRIEMFGERSIEIERFPSRGHLFRRRLVDVKLCLVAIVCVSIVGWMPRRRS